MFTCPLSLRSFRRPRSVRLEADGTAAVVPRGRLHLGVPRELLHGAQVGTSVQQVGDERTTQIVRAEALHTGDPAAPPERPGDAVRDTAAWPQLATLGDGPEQRP